MVNVIKKLLLRLSEYMEIILAVYLLVVLVLVIGRIIVLETPTILTEGTSIHHFLEGSLTLAVAIEFVKMLCMHTPGTLIEVLLFAIARHMIVESLSPINNLIIVLAIVTLFAARKHLLTAHDQKGMNEQQHGTRGIVEEILHVRKERHALAQVLEGSQERKRLQKAERELLRREEEKASAESGKKGKSAG